jgi:chorismate mutase
MVENLDSLRRKINRLDKNIISNLALRYNVVERIGKYKKLHNLPACDKKRELEVLKIRTKQGNGKGLDDAFVKKIYELIFEEALRIQKCGK